MNKNIAWILLIIAAVFEVGWVVGLKYATSYATWGLTVVAIIVSFSLLIWTGRVLPVGTAYAVFVGLGTVGTVLVDHVIFAEPFRLAVLFFIGVLIIGVVGLKVSTTEKVERKEGE
ncbi:DMT family transporter [Halalkalibacter okhensis]|uniref:Multidrug resistance protein SMR n=1 Tax=Halalkalibacter okhensis TaxID=333138 RepID=A0A0B0IA16_9BACI|nr:multidrug efflux SMR transporter [Halalkalibacter okhensis]KHF38140.1 multidrug resistance protein SMR [Halalkalibacter okhensis]